MNYLSATFLLPVFTAAFLLLWVSLLGTEKCSFAQKFIWKFIPLVLAFSLTLLAFGVIK